MISNALFRLLGIHFNSFIKGIFNILYEYIIKILNSYLNPNFIIKIKIIYYIILIKISNNFKIKLY